VLIVNSSDTEESWEERTPSDGHFKIDKDLVELSGEQKPSYQLWKDEKGADSQSKERASKQGGLQYRSKKRNIKREN